MKNIELTQEEIEALKDFYGIRNEWFQRLPVINKMKKYQYIMDYISDICGYLDIEIPLISLANPKEIELLIGPGTVATFVEEDYQIVLPDTIRKMKKNEFSSEIIRIIAHELRHVWQATKGRVYFKKSYNDLSLETEWQENDYELDAQAFSTVIMKFLFDLDLEKEIAKSLSYDKDLKKKYKAMVKKLYKDIEKDW